MDSACAQLPASERYQVILKASGREVSLRLNHDPSFAASCSLRVMSPIGCEPEVTKALMRALRPGDSAIDIGANLGFFSILMAKLVGEHGQVAAIDPFTENCYRADEHFALNGLVNAKTHNLAAWDSVRDLPFYTCQDSGEGSLRSHGGSNGSYTVRAMPVDQILPNWTPKAVKIDAEGAELHVLKGMPQILATCPFWFVELNVEALVRFGHTPHAVRVFMKDCGFDCFLLRETGELPILLPAQSRVHTRRLNFMVLFSTIETVGRYWQDVQLDTGP